jgi:hypothetical protein
MRICVRVDVSGNGPESPVVRLPTVFARSSLTPPPLGHVRDTFQEELGHC